MKKLLIILPFLLSLSLSSCSTKEKENEKVFNKIVEEQSYDEVYAFSVAPCVFNNLAPESDQYNFYAEIFTIYGSIDNVDTFYVYGIAEWGPIFDPYIYEWPLNSSYDDCLSLFKENMPAKNFNKTREDNISFITNDDLIDVLFNQNDITLDVNFALQCDNNNFIYQSDGKINYKYIEYKK